MNRTAAARRMLMFARILNLLCIIASSAVLTPGPAWAFRPVEPEEEAGPQAVPPAESPDLPSGPMKTLRRWELPKAPDAHTHHQRLGRRLAGQPRGRPDLERAVRQVLMEQQELLGGVATGHLKLSYLAELPATEHTPATTYVQFIQEEHSLPVEDSYVHATLQRLPQGAVLVAARAQLYPRLALPPPSPQPQAELDRRGSEGLGLAAGSRPASTHRSLLFLEGRWRRVQQMRFEGQELSALVDEETGETWPLDERLYADGSVEGRGVAFDPIATGDNLDRLSLSDLEVRANTGTATFTDDAGRFSLADPAATTLSATLAGRWVTVLPQQGTALSLSSPADTGLTLLFQPTGNAEFDTAQVNAYHHTARIHDWLQAQVEVPISGLDRQLPAKVNRASTCNAYYTLNPPSTTYYAAGGGCVNTAYDTVIFHEYGHFADHMAGGITNGGLSEGWGDLLAAFLTWQPLSGEGFFGPGTFVRTADNDYQYPEAGVGPVHALGQAWSGFAWDLHEGLIASVGQDAGRLLAEELVVPTLAANAPTIPAAVDEVLYRSDDDGDLSNGTPYLTQIFAAAASHSIPVPAFSGSCAITSPADLATVSQSQSPVEIRGTATGLGTALAFQFYELAYLSDSAPDTWISIGPPRTAAVLDGVLAAWDIGVLPDGLYTLRLVVTTSQGPLSDMVRVILERNPARRITTDPAFQLSPAISGNWIVWHDNRNSDYDIYLYDLTTNTERRLTTDPAYQMNPAIFGTRIVWDDNRNGASNSDIYLYDLTTNTERRLTTDPAHQRYPAISGDRVVWQDTRHSGTSTSKDIYLYDLTTNTEQRLTADPTDQGYPAISGNRVVWQDYRNGNYDIYLYDLTTNTEQRLTTDPAHQMAPAIAGDRVVWQDYRNGNYDIYLYDLTTNTERRLTTDPAHQMAPAIAGDRVVWYDSRHGNSDIYLYDLTTNTETRLTSHPAPQMSPAIAGRRIVWGDDRNGASDIYLKELPIKRPIKVLCTHLASQGLLSSGWLTADVAYAERFIAPETLRAYQAWALPVVKFLEHSRLATRLAQPGVAAWARHMAYVMGATGQDSRLGRWLHTLGVPLHRWMGQWLR